MLRVRAEKKYQLFCENPDDNFRHDSMYQPGLVTTTGTPQNYGDVSELKQVISFLRGIFDVPVIETASSA